MSLARLASVPTTAQTPAPQERCDFCAEPIDTQHAHAVDVNDRRILCACRPCYLLFTPAGASQGRFRAIPARYAAISGFGDGDEPWDAMQLPVGLAFFFFSTPANKTVAFYPSPAGATESLLPLDAWNDLCVRHPELASMQPDVEALLVDLRPGPERRGFIVPIDACYELVGLIRTSWKGFDGGDARELIERFFEGVDERARF